MTDRVPADVFPPADILAEELAARGWSWETFAARGGLSPEEVAAIQAGERIGAALAEKVEAGLGGPSAAFWLNLDRSWRRRTG